MSKWFRTFLISFRDFQFRNYGQDAGLVKLENLMKNTPQTQNVHMPGIWSINASDFMTEDLQPQLQHTSVDES